MRGLRLLDWCSCDAATEKAYTALICEVRREGSDEVISTIKSRYSAFLDIKVWPRRAAPSGLRGTPVKLLAPTRGAHSLPATA